MTARQRLAELGLDLPEPAVPVATYVPFRRDGDVVYLSGQGPRKAGGGHHVGKVGAGVSVEEAREHARLTGLSLLAVAETVTGSLDDIEVLKVFGMVNADPGFARHPEVINGCSDLFVAALGDAGRHARSAVGMGSLPNGMTVEIEAIVRIRPK